MVNTIYIARHGFRSNWAPNPPPPPTGIEGDVRLAIHGCEQAEQLSQFLMKRTPYPQRIYSSPFFRCVETSNPTAEKMDLEIFIENGVAEWFKKGHRSHIPTAPSSPEQLHEFFPRVNTAYKSMVVCSPEGEDTEEIHERAKRAIKCIVEDLEKNHPEIEAVMITTHAATKIALGRALLNDSTKAIRAGVCSLDIYQRPDTNSSWEITHSGVEHLIKGEEMNWDFENEFGAGADDNDDPEKRRLIELATKIDS
ncbi:phosphoglycerate mutase-like protein [Nadsonia fulvescens var. elongata DSM 6958]|uniref:Phosphoglycerate mutase-like protein n=1 Tax=Nadsonia fulvescens var. elongata DSM 6958 TaxID=857566 RepID=A0A1E3PDD0_9ASCO|nr:phosphoglycerate mutase-like protein [Nadsonia fulvescens var. elongata DSM 6958]